ncbi:hypothetical protein [Serratia entomophila]|uniref:hypothetical protein n=1 Tax=Serratia entomophila TaxID=42906 RepID=UPI0021774BFA|nr:hypothetical protein [Serratia entomophila]CAI0901800.1 Uncharacterised protein [Serratia entomophila]CAI1538818.1 Uncharacterised protein [Serratia entomophila]CAI1588992.1 Uncharacterised protein [Serratia entomophila]CAI1595666.1 Uncharacterised protein [Serratia entomophila]CAI1596128.1 Uncharacterised protein [Serratia entomophila]
MRELSVYDVEEVSGGAGLVEIGGLSPSINISFNPQFEFNATDSLGLGVAITGISNAVEKGYEYTGNAIGSIIGKGLGSIGNQF